MRKATLLALFLAAFCFAGESYGDDDVMSVGFQFSSTTPHGPSKLTDVASSGLHFRVFYEVINLSDRWQMVGEFGYNTFSLQEDDYAAVVGPALEDSINAAFPLGPDFPAGSVATLESFAISGGDFNAMHFTAGAKYLLMSEDQSPLLPYVTAQVGLYSTGQSDSDVSTSFNITRPGLADTTLNVPSEPWTRDVDRDNAFGFSLGGGAELFLTDDLALVADLRYHVAYTKETTNFLDIGLGVAYQLGF